MLGDGHQEAFLRTLRHLVRIPSRSSPEGGEEGPLQQWVAAEMRRAGARVRTFEADDLAAFRTHTLCHGPERDYRGRLTVVAEMGPPDAPALLIAAHSDTVPLDATRPASEWTVDPFGGLVRDGRMYGLGVGDDKWGVATMLTLACALAEAPGTLSRRVIFASTMDEEHGVGNGMLLLALAGVKAEMALYLDGGDGRIAVGLLGGSNLVLRPRKATGAERLRQDAQRLKALAAAMSRARAPLFDRRFYDENPVRHRSVAFKAGRDREGEFLRLAFYTLPDETRPTFAAEIEAAVRRALGADADRYVFDYREPWFEPSFVDPAHPVVKNVAAAYRRVMGAEPRIGTSSKQDAFVLVNHAGLPTVSFGAARFDGYGAYHQPDENIEIAFAWRCVQVAAEMVRRWVSGEAT